MTNDCPGVAVQEVNGSRSFVESIATSKAKKQGG
jgi:hypothetical protein